MNLEKQEEKIWNFPDGSHIWFTSDTHFGHDNIIKFCNRPFKDANEMNKVLIENWNRVVQPDDIVFHLGDFAFGGSYLWNNMLHALNGKIILIKGNHDIKNLRQGYAELFEGIYSQLQITIEGQKIYLNHYPFLCYGGVYRKEPVWQLFGHVHSSPQPDHLHEGRDDKRLTMLFPTQYDVGVDNNNFTPISFYQVKQIIEEQINGGRH